MVASIASLEAPSYRGMPLSRLHTHSSINIFRKTWKYTSYYYLSRNRTMERKRVFHHAFKKSKWFVVLFTKYFMESSTSMETQEQTLSLTQRPLQDIFQEGRITLFTWLLEIQRGVCAFPFCHVVLGFSKCDFRVLSYSSPVDFVRLQLIFRCSHWCGLLFFKPSVRPFVISFVFVLCIHSFDFTTLTFGWFAVGAFAGNNGYKDIVH